MSFNSKNLSRKASPYNIHHFHFTSEMLSLAREICRERIICPLGLVYTQQLVTPVDCDKLGAAIHSNHFDFESVVSQCSSVVRILDKSAWRTLQGTSFILCCMVPVNGGLRLTCRQGRLITSLLSLMQTFLHWSQSPWTYFQSRVPAIVKLLTVFHVNEILS